MAATTPQKAADQRERATAHLAGVGLADGPAKGVNTARARAAATIHRPPVNGVVLRVGSEHRECQQQYRKAKG
jgi:hypothetical protein